MRRVNPVICIKKDDNLAARGFPSRVSCSRRTPVLLGQELDPRILRPGLRIDGGRRSIIHDHDLDETVRLIQYRPDRLGEVFRLIVVSRNDIGHQFAHTESVVGPSGLNRIEGIPEVSLDILYIRPGGSGWGPVSDLARLATEVLQGRLMEMDDTGRPSFLRRGAVMLPRGPRPKGRRLLVIAGNPAALAFAAHRRLWAPGYESTAAWVIDSFWTDRIAGIAKHRPHFDHMFITDPDLVDEWTRLSGRPVSVLPWGADTLAFPPATAERHVVLLRLGRQPEAWSEDATTAAEARERGLTFAGRPRQSTDPGENQAIVRKALADSKLVLAFSNRVSAEAYTHPTREYLTGRWMDALAAGCLVAGVAPASSSELLWPEATMEISPTDRDAAWPEIARAAADWTPECAVRQQARARSTVDWRWRLRDLCRTLGWDDLEQKVEAAAQPLCEPHR